MQNAEEKPSRTRRPSILFILCFSYFIPTFLHLFFFFFFFTQKCPGRDTKAELNPRCQVCESLADTGIRVAKMEIIVVVSSFKRRNNPAMTIPAELVQRLATAKNVTVLTGPAYPRKAASPRFARPKPACGRNSVPKNWPLRAPSDAIPVLFGSGMSGGGSLSLVRNQTQRTSPWWKWRASSAVPSHYANVDGLHQRAGSRHVIELHGNITRTKCSDEGTIVSTWKDTATSRRNVRPVAACCAPMWFGSRSRCRKRRCNWP